MYIVYLCLCVYIYTLTIDTNTHTHTHTCLGPNQHLQELRTSFLHLSISKESNWDPFPHPKPKMGLY